MTRFLPCAAVAVLCFFHAQADAAGVYKSIGPDGVVEFSDKSPDRSAGIASDYELGASDAAVQRAGALVDLAERAVALARSTVWSHRDFAKLPKPRMARADIERIAFYAQELRSARLALCQLLQAKRSRGIREDLTASYAAPVSRP